MFASSLSIVIFVYKLGNVKFIHFTILVFFLQPSIVMPVGNNPSGKWQLLCNTFFERKENKTFLSQAIYSDKQ
jgi:hypothetical protein